MKVTRRNFGRLLAAMLLFLCANVLAASADTAARQISLEDAKMIIEFNSTDEDIGVQIFLDGEAWKKMAVFDPDGRKVFELSSKGKLKKLGITELFFESEEPSLDDLPLPDFLALFPEGVYKFSGTTVEGEKIEGNARFEHNIPDGPSIVSPARKGEVRDIDKVNISWAPVTTPAGIRIAGYQVIVEGDRPLRTFQVDLPATATNIKVPPIFLESGKRFKVEVLAKEVGGNQTITESGFKVR